MHTSPQRLPLSFVCRAATGHSSLSLRRANSPQLFQLFLSNSIYNKLCLNFCLSDNNNNTIIIWSITYSQLYLIKAVISLKGFWKQSKPQELYHPDPSVGITSAREQGGWSRGPRSQRPPTGSSFWSPGAPILEPRREWVCGGLGPNTQSGTSQNTCMDFF